MGRPAKASKKALTLSEAVSMYYEDPLGFVMFAWPWGVKSGPLENSPGPDENQIDFLDRFGKLIRARRFNGRDPVAPIRMSRASAHGTGKSTLLALICWFILSTRPRSIGTMTAGTFQQLEERTWADAQHWGRMCVTAPWFNIQASGIFSVDPQLREHWKVTPKTALEARAQSFAGQHAATSTSWFAFDEASEVPEGVWTTSYGGLTDGEPMFFAMGQMLRNSGEFFNVTFGDARKNWDYGVIDGRTSAFTNKSLIEEWRNEWGEDSDRWRVRVLGLPPKSSELQFIGQGLVDEARNRDHKPLLDEPLIWGYDAANGGQGLHAFAARRGLDAASIPPIFLPGDADRDRVVAVATDLMRDRTPGRKAAAMFGDQAFGSVILERLRNLGYTNVFEVNFGATQTPDPTKCFNMRAYMWDQMREFLHLGSIPNEPKLYQQLTGPGFHHRSGRLVLESKEEMKQRGVESPHWADALALTWAGKVAIPAPPKKMQRPPSHDRYLVWA